MPPLHFYTFFLLTLRAVPTVGQRYAITPNLADYYDDDNTKPPQKSPEITPFPGRPLSTGIPLRTRRLPYVNPTPQGDDDSTGDTGGNTRRPFIYCSFDKDFCGFTNDSKSDFFWTRRSMKGPPNTGPEHDHTEDGGDTGFYAIMEVGKIRRGAVARLRSPLLFSPAHCFTLSFWYYAYGANLGQLSVLTLSSPGSHDEMWDTVFMANHANNSNRANQEVKAWQYFETTAPLYDPHYAVVFEGQAGDGPEGDYAIDDINIRAMTCPAGVTRLKMSSDAPNLGAKLAAAVNADAAATQKPVNNGDSGPKLSETAIAAIVIAVLLAIIAIVPIVIYLGRRYCKKKLNLGRPAGGRPSTTGASQLEEHPSAAPEVESNVDYGHLASSSVASTPRITQNGYDQRDNLGHLRQNGGRNLNEVAITIIDRHGVPKNEVVDDGVDLSTPRTEQNPTPPPVIFAAPPTVIITPPAPVITPLPMQHSAPDLIPKIAPPTVYVPPPVPVHVAIPTAVMEHVFEETVEHDIISSSSSDTESDSTWTNDGVPPMPTRRGNEPSSTTADMTTPTAGRIFMTTSSDDGGTSDDESSEARQGYLTRRDSERRFAASNNSTTLYEYPNAHSWMNQFAVSENSANNQSIAEETPTATPTNDPPLPINHLSWQQFDEHGSG